MSCDLNRTDSSFIRFWNYDNDYDNDNDNDKDKDKDKDGKSRKLIIAIHVFCVFSEIKKN